MEELRLASLVALPRRKSRREERYFVLRAKG